MNRVFYTPSFARQVENLLGKEQELLEKALDTLMRFLQTGERSKGLGYKKIGPEHFEIRVDIHTRIGMKKFQGDYYLMVYGNHDDIQRFLKRQ